MQGSKSLKCSNCSSLVLNISKTEMKKLDGLNFECECCGHGSLLHKGNLVKGTNRNDSILKVAGFYKVSSCK